MKPTPKNGVVRTSCGLCLTFCGMLVHLQNGKVVKIEGDPESPQTEGRLCARGLAAAERLYHPDRLKHPQKRSGERGEGKWQQISWDEALDTIANEMIKAKEDYGAESVAFMFGSAKGYHIESFVGRFANAFGTPNIGNASHVCHNPTMFATIMTCGALPVPDYEYPPACILLWGMNPVETTIVADEPIRRALNKGTKLIVVDPRNVGFASQASLWLQIRPGTDLALALGMLNVIVNEGLYDRAFVDNWTVGFDKLKSHVQDYSPQRVEEITWVPADTIIKAARLYATSKPACIPCCGNPLEHNINSFQTGRAISILKAITGNLAVPGGDLIRKPVPAVQRNELALNDKLPKEQREKRIGDKYVPMFSYVPFQSLIKAILEDNPYPIRVAYILGTNPLLTYSNAHEVYRALNKVNFVAASDMFMTPSAELSDIVLPAASFLEFDSISTPRVVQIQQKVAQVGECWPDHKILNELAKKAGIGEYFWDDADEYLDDVLKPCGITFEEFRKIGIIRESKVYRTYEREGFNTPSKKVEIYSSRLQEWGFDPLPVYHELPETPISDPELAKEYPLIFTSCKKAPFRHSSDRNIRTLRGMQPEPLVEIHPETAKGLGIEDGDWVYIENKRGRIKQKAVLTTGIDPRVVHVDYGWWYPEKGREELYGWAESNVNVLTLSEPPYSREIGSNQLRGILCKVYKVS